MGRDKALINVGGVPLAARAVEVLRRAGASAVATVGGDGQRLAVTGSGHVEDEHPGAGPLGGVLTALHWSPTPVVVVLAVDLVDLDAATVRRLVDALDGADVAVAHGGRDEPLCSVWRVATCEPALQAAFAIGERAVHRAWAGLDVVRVMVEPARLTNANMPEDLAGR